MILTLLRLGSKFIINLVSTFALSWTLDPANCSPDIVKDSCCYSSGVVLSTWTSIEPSLSTGAIHRNQLPQRSLAKKGAVGECSEDKLIGEYMS